MRDSAIIHALLTGLLSAAALASAAIAQDMPAGSAPRAVSVARATEIPACTLFVDAAATGSLDGTAQNPHSTIAAAVEAADPGALICVAEGTYAETLSPGEKYFTLAGGFQSGQEFKVRDSALYVTKATGKGGSFIRIEDPAPRDNQLTAIDGFDISGYAQAIYRDVYYSQRFDITNNHIHDNVCDDSLVGAGFALNNVSGEISNNVFRNNRCGRGGAGFLNDTTNQNTVRIERNLIDANAGTEPDTAHGGALYLFGNTLRITGNLFTRNTVTQWGAGLYIGAYRPGGQPTSATLNWNIYRGNIARNAGGGMFCDDGAVCTSFHEIYDGNCGGNIYFDGGSDGGGPTTGTFDNLTNVGALDSACENPGPGVRVDKEGTEPDTYSFVNAIFWNNAPGADLAVTCIGPCPGAGVNISYSLVQTEYVAGGMRVSFGDG
ncbi:MAG: right-handed parallel beta-helix repeat-containing protein, partial [Parvibaculaceae bacterium]